MNMDNIWLKVFYFYYVETIHLNKINKAWGKKPYPHLFGEVANVRVLFWTLAFGLNIYNKSKLPSVTIKHINSFSFSKDLTELECVIIKISELDAAFRKKKIF